MASSSSLIAIIVVSLLFTTSSAQLSPIAVHCDNRAGNYTANSTFLDNLSQLTTFLSSNGSAAGYSDSTVGSVPDRVYGLVLCRGDVNSSTCRNCLDFAGQDVLDRCPLNKAATIWYDSCLLRYSNERFATIVERGWMHYMWNSHNITSDWPRFNASVVNLMDKLAQYASYNTSAPLPRLFATGEMAFDDKYPKIYGLVQCTRDLSDSSCEKCLRGIFGYLPNCCDQKIGGRVIAASCNFRYEVGKFYGGTSRLSLPEIAPTTLAPAMPPTMSSTNSTDRGNKKDDTGKILAIVIPVGAVLVLLLVCCTIFLRRKGSAMKYHKTNRQEIATAESLLFDLPTIITATDNFAESNKLGEGGFGAVYKGKLADGQEIAVKRLSATSGQGIEELRNEVVLLAKLQHRNLVRLMGVCLVEEEKLLIYEYVLNRSLDTILFDLIKKEQLYWEKRYMIIGGIARGMLYLHEESQINIIHRDLKVSNILLDSNMNPKISDFGLARLFGGDQTHASTIRIAGTYGYMSPEYAMRGQFSNKSDVFSFGVLVLEIVIGRKNSDFFSSQNSTDLLSYVWEHWSNGTVSNIVDPSLGGNYSQAEVLRCIQIGLLCVQEAPSKRPTMSTVVLMLNSYSISVQVPSRPAFIYGYSITGSFNQDKSFDSGRGTASGSTTKSALCTPNEPSITETDLR